MRYGLVNLACVLWTILLVLAIWHVLRPALLEAVAG
jgi:hypothetical protein